ncbi:hypothetical protein [Flavobacterium psychrolimnae]|uniref:Uncharacterized protein n=1 Tax=Flavobacterium psychrolimnae TaxID=249351 RepID=A0A366B261_9FLAO|nr:hypothetical protein [Flavobacterium psychrolimnae]RBN51096.1 hypothetical protein DR980_04540 [Flavobacterium psychrolimnae]
MKYIKINLILIIILSLTMNSIKAQSASFLSSERVSVLLIFFEYDYKFNNNSYEPYQPDYSYMQNVYGTMQARYDKGFDIIKTELYKYNKLKFINKTNIILLDQHKKANNTFYQSIKGADLSQSSNIQRCLEVICSIYEYDQIRSEIELIKRCNAELSRISIKDPDNFIYSLRYKAICKVLNELETCSSSEIKNLSWEQTELSMNQKKY